MTRLALVAHIDVPSMVPSRVEECHWPAQDIDFLIKKSGGRRYQCRRRGHSPACCIVIFLGVFDRRWRHLTIVHLVKSARVVFTACWLVGQGYRFA